MTNRTIVSRSWPLQELRVRQEGEKSQLSWYAAVFDSLSEDLGGFRERVGRRAFNKTVKEHDIRALFNHNPDFVMGRNRTGTLSLHVDHEGLRAEVDLPDTQWARDLSVSVERGDINAGSFAFEVVRETWDWGKEGDQIVRVLDEVRLYDVSIVSYPAYPATEGVSLRAVLPPGIDPDDLLHPLVRLRAGAPLGDDERGRLESVLTQIRGAITAPEPDPEPGDHSAAAAARRRHLELLQLRGER